MCGEECAAICGERRRGEEGSEGVLLRMCAIEQPPVMRGSMLTRMVSNTAWGNSSFTPRPKPSSLFCLPSSVNIPLSPGTDSGVNRNQIMHTNTSVTQDFQVIFLSHTHIHTHPHKLSYSLSPIPFSPTNVCVPFATVCFAFLLSSSLVSKGLQRSSDDTWQLKVVPELSASLHCAASFPPSSVKTQEHHLHTLCWRLHISPVCCIFYISLPLLVQCSE